MTGRTAAGPGLFPWLEPAEPPWPTALAWQGVNDALARLIDAHGPRLGAASLAARTATTALAELFPWLDDLVRQANPLCRENCCRVARVYYQLDDLIYLHLGGRAIPPAQTRASPEEACRYLTATGCNLPRQVRPWHCTWFICGVQLQVLGRMPPRRQRRFSALFQEVIDQRRRMIEAFQNVTDDLSPSPGSLSRRPPPD